MKYGRFGSGFFFLLPSIILISAAIILPGPVHGQSIESTGVLAFINNVDSTRELFVINPDGSNRRRISFNDTAEQLGADFSADGKTVAFEFFSNIYVMRSNGAGIRQLTFTSNNSGPSISRDGTKVAFTSNRNGNTDIYTVKVDGTGLVRVTTNQFIDSRASFSPDGTKIIFDSNRNSQFGLPNLYLINADGTNETRLTDLFEFGGRFSPDGSKITYMGRPADDQDNFHEIFVMNADGSNRAQLTENTVPNDDPTFSLDGTLIAFNRTVPTSEGNADQTFVMGTNGANVRQVTFFDLTRGPTEIARWVPHDLLSKRQVSFDFDGEGKADISVFRGSDQNWYRKNSFEGSYAAMNWGLAPDTIVPADYDSDARTDHAIFREGVWWIFRSTDGHMESFRFGQSGDIPVAGDFDGDGIADLCVFRSSTGVWWRQFSSNGQVDATQFGQDGDVPINGDFDGDGRQDIAVYRPSDLVWHVLRSSNGQAQSNQFGTNGDIPLSGDFNGDGKSDITVFRPSTGVWYVAKPTGVPSQNFEATSFGISTDIPVPADYDGDGRTDIAVYREGVWWILRSSNGAAVAEQFGLLADRPIAASR